MAAMEERSRYCSDQGVKISRVPILVAGSLAAAAGAAWILKTLFVMNWYLVLFVPLFISFLLAGAIYLLVGLSHCRNAWLAGFLGILTGVTAYLGYYYLCMVYSLPPGIAPRISLLPDYIQFRIRNDMPQRVARLLANNQPQRPSVIPNWLLFFSELGVLAVFPGAAGWRRARHAYCPELRRWMSREVAYFPEHAGDDLRRAFEAGQLEKFIAGNSLASDSPTASRLILEFAWLAEHSPASYPIYGSIEALPLPKPWYLPKKVRVTFVRQIALQPSEILALLPVFPHLAQLINVHHAGISDLAKPDPSTAQPAAQPTSIAAITPAPAPFYQQVRNSHYSLQVNLRGAISLLYFFGGLGMIVFGWFYLRGWNLAVAAPVIILGL